MTRYKTHMSAENFKNLKSEHTIQTECINYLRAMGYYVQRMNSGVIPADYTYKTGIRKGTTVSRRLFLSSKGTPDVLAFKDCGTRHHLGFKDNHILFLEIKRPGNEPTFIQQQTMSELTEYGARCLVVHSLEELQSVL